MRTVNTYRVKDEKQPTAQWPATSYQNNPHSAWAGDPQPSIYLCGESPGVTLCINGGVEENRQAGWRVEPESFRYRGAGGVATMSIQSAMPLVGPSGAVRVAPPVET